MAGQEGSNRTERGAAGDPYLRRHLEASLHQPAGAEVGLEDIESGFRDFEIGYEGCEVVCYECPVKQLLLRW